MSTRQLLNLTLGAFTLLLFAAIGIVFSASGDNTGQGVQIDMALREQALIQDLTRQTAQLSNAQDRAAVNAARQTLAGTIVQFDRNLAALIHGGEGITAAGQNVPVQRTGNETAQLALADAARVWLETGLPLSDLAAGEFSIYSAAGQTAVQDLQDNSVELMQHMGATANAMRMGIHARSTITGYARWAAGGLAIIVVGFAFYRRKILAAEAIAAPPTAAMAPAPEPVLTNQAPVTHQPSFDQPQSQPVPLRPAERAHQSFVSPVNFESVNASVDQMSVDMNTIAGSTDKMRQAIDSVGHALQGMLYSLNEMAQDTAEGHKIVRNANNAASFSADTAGDLAASAREMSAVVARVTQLAMSTKSVAAQIDGDALHTGKTGEAFTSVVAGEVKGLAQQTNEATQQIEQTVADILATARQYEEAIGQIIKNVSAINKVSQNLGELMTSPPPRVEPGPPIETPAVAAVMAAAPTLAAALPVSEPAVEAVPEPVAQDTSEADTQDIPEFDELFVPEDKAASEADETAAAIEEVGQATADSSEETPDEPANEVFMLGQTTKKPDALNIPAPPPVAEPVSEPIAEPIAEPSAEPAVEIQDDSVFMLGSKPSTPQESDVVTEVIEEVQAEEPVAEEASEAVTVPADETSDEPSDEPAATGSSGNIFMLNKPK